MNDDQVRDVTYFDAGEHQLSVEEVHQMFLDAGFPRSARSIQRWCNNGHLKSVKYPTETGERFYIDPESVSQRIEAIRQVQEATHGDMSSRDTARRSVAQQQTQDEIETPNVVTSDDGPRRRFHDGGESDEKTTEDKDVKKSEDQRQASPSAERRDMSSEIGLEKELMQTVIEQQKIISGKDQLIQTLINKRISDQAYYLNLLAEVDKTARLPGDTSESIDASAQTVAQKIEPLQPEARGDNESEKQNLGGV